MWGDNSNGNYHYRDRAKQETSSAKILPSWLSNCWLLNVNFLIDKCLNPTIYNHMTSIEIRKMSSNAGLKYASSLLKLLFDVNLQSSDIRPTNSQQPQQQLLWHQPSCSVTRTRALTAFEWYFISLVFEKLRQTERWVQVQDIQINWNFNTPHLTSRNLSWH